MFFNFIGCLPRIPSGIRYSRRCFSVFPTSKSYVNNLMDILHNNLDLPRIHGPTAEEVVKDIDLSGKTCLITGANSGVGLEMTRCMSARNCSVLMACRNAYAANVVRNSSDKPHLLHFYETNLASLKSVKKTSDEILSRNQNIDIVILNAGVFGLPWTLTDDGLETTFQVNYLSQYYLLMNIEKILAPNARVVFVSSESHRNIKWSMENILTPHKDILSLPEEEYTSIRAYNVSKLCGLLAMHYLGYRWLNTGKQVFSAHPGSFVKTNLCRNWWVYEALYTSMLPFSKSIRQAASTPLYCATSPDLEGLSALYYKDCERCDESELARNFHLSFRIQDLTYDLLRDRILSSDEATQVSKSTDYPVHDKHSMDDNTLISNYSG
ncbi:WW domain-containing oxidoreductase-like isoform X2 [Ostrinia furnacalis]|uniref:WW domain-containing oxidoreductase-like isoform X2 n=2 Tax=Ostrinia furnacalis TaxID=93504 RepID=UPI001039A01E|nr:WW domain-containing oxidoreductase-like isoform X2 [Ostrinia furnacalis]